MADEGADQKPATQRVSLLNELANAPHEPAPEGTTSEQIGAFLAVAMTKHREGDLAEAELMYRQALRWQPDHPDRTISLAFWPRMSIVRRTRCHCSSTPSRLTPAFPNITRTTATR